MNKRYISSRNQEKYCKCLLKGIIDLVKSGNSFVDVLDTFELDDCDFDNLKEAFPELLEGEEDND